MVVKRREVKATVERQSIRYTPVAATHFDSAIMATF